MRMVHIRPEREGDRGEIRRVVRAAFGQDDEVVLIDRLRGAAEPFVSLVAADHGQVIGHILYTPATLAECEAGARMMCLAPLAVDPERQGEGIGSALIARGFEACRALGVDVVFVLGHAAYYLRRGFEPANAFGLIYQSETNAPAFFLRELNEGVLVGARGKVRFHRAFDDI